MARPLRIEYEGAFYHVTSRGNERKRLFFGKGDYDKFKEYLFEAQDKYGYRLHCYVLMTIHFHLLIETSEGNMSKVVLRSEHVLRALCAHVGVPADRLGEVGTVLRDMVICLLKRHTSVTNRQIGELFQGLTYSGVSKANHRFSLQIPENKEMRKTVDRITRSMSNVKT